MNSARILVCLALQLGFSQCSETVRLWNFVLLLLYIETVNLVQCCYHVSRFFSALEENCKSFL
jgi:hypothetical protein